MAALVFTPLLMERVWGGRRLARYGKSLPAGVPIGESWEIVDRPEAQSVVASGPLGGATLGDLWRDRRGLFGARGAASTSPRFPLLVKLLDATQTLSVQVHPPAAVAAELGGEPKSETWLVLDAEPGAQLFVGLAAGVTRASFTDAMRAGEDVSPLLHRVDVAAGDAIHIPSGRVHAIGAGCLIVEVQQSSDTTYRVYDWQRPGLDGRPRPLHLEESLRSLDFTDVEPALVPRGAVLLSATPWFTERRQALAAPARVQAPGECAVVAVLAGAAAIGDARLALGGFALLPPDAPDAVPLGGEAELLVIELPAVQRSGGV